MTTSTIFDNIEINNCVSIDELYNGKEWIHGKSTNNIDITIFLITISSHHLQYSLDCINNLNLNNNVLVNVIKDVSPTNRAYNTMVERCRTNLFIQLDEDMEVYENCIDIMMNEMKEVKNHKLKNTFLFTYRLIDEYLGLGNPPTLCGIKLYSFEIMKNFKIQNFENAVSQVDKLWHTPIHNAGYVENVFPVIVGHHALHRTPYDLLIRYSKSTTSALNTKIKKNSGDKCRLIRPINRFVSKEKFNEFYSNVVWHFVSLGYNIEVFNKNHKILHDFLIAYTNKKSINDYGLDSNNYYVVPEKINEYDANTLHNINDKNTANINDKFAVIGIINALFENYAYSFEKYPKEINEYFTNIINTQLLFFESL